MNPIIIKIKEYIKDHKINNIINIKKMMKELNINNDNIIKIMYFIELEKFRNSFK